jgi:predicted nucleotidyltransferase
MKSMLSKTATPEKKETLISRITTVLQTERPVIIAYLYGSFTGAESFRDLDVAVYLDTDILRNTSQTFEYALTLGTELDIEISEVTVDLVPLNLAPLPFAFAVLSRGRLLFSRDEQERVNYEARIRSLYFDFLPHLRFYYKSIVLGD